jgi:Spy/CpxP family protein refolding chaperone
MNRIRLFVAGTILMFTLSTVAQQSTTNSNAHDAMGDGPTVEKQLTLLTEKLDLTADQQTKTKTILQQLDETTQKIMQDESMSRDERSDNVRTCHHQADKELRRILNDDQKKKLDQFEQEPHPEMHVNVNAPTPPPAPQM